MYHNGFARSWLAQQMAAVGLQDIEERTAAVMTKPARDGQLRDFSIFLLTGREPRRA